MHILYLHQHFVARSGTSGGRSHEFSRILVERGHKVSLISGSYDHSGLEGSRLVTRMDVDGIDLWMLRIPYSQRMSSLQRIGSFLLFMILSTWFSLRIKGVDVVFATSTPLTIAVPGMIASFLRRCPFVFEVRDLWPEIPIAMGLFKNPVLIALARGLERLAYRRAREIVALSPGMKSGILAQGIPAERITVIPNSSDVELFRVPPERGAEFRATEPEIGDRPLVVYAGAFGRVNGLEYALHLADRVKALDSRIAFLFIGKGSEEARLLELAEEIGVLEKNVYFRKPMSRSELPNALAAATIVSSFVIPLPILEHNSANKFFDAFAAGKPIAINHRGWQADLLQREGAGLVLDPESPERAADQLLTVLHDPDRLEAAGRASQRLGDEQFNRRLLALQLEEVLLRSVDPKQDRTVAASN